jgi:hypothetical protein
VLASELDVPPLASFVVPVLPFDSPQAVVAQPIARTAKPLRQDKRANLAFVPAMGVMESSLE